MKFERSSGNVFADLGLPHAEERQRLARKFSGKLALFLAACAALTGCATTQTRYAPTYCIQPGDLPSADQCAGKVKASAKLLALCEPPRVHSELTGQADKDLRIVAGSAVRLRAWGEGLNTILEGCREK